MTPLPRVAVVLALVVVLATAGPSAGIVVDAPADEGSTPVTTDGGADESTAASSTEDRDRATAPADAGPARSRVIANRTPNRLGAGEGRVESGFATPRLDLGASLSMGDGEFRGAYVTYLARERMATADTNVERREVIRDVLNRTERRIEVLREREAVAIRSYHNGSIDRRELLRRLASIDAEAATLRSSLANLLENYPVVTTAFETPIFSQRRDLRSLEGPVRDQVRRALQGQADPVRVHVTASSTGLVIEAIGEELYVREAVRMDHYAPDAPPDPSIFDNISGHLHELYPETIAAVQTDYIVNSVGDRLFEVTKSHSMGGLTLYLDRSTGEVYREVQRLRLERIPNATVASAAGDDLRVVVNRTDTGNPYRVSVVDNSTGVPIDAQISVAGREVGRTGDDGVLWTLGPAGSFNVSATAGGDRVNVTVPG